MTEPAAPFPRADHPLLFVTLSLDIGGTERHLAEITPALRRRGWPVTVFCFNSRGLNADAVAAHGVEVVGPPVEARLSRSPRLGRLAYLPLAAGRLARVIRRRRPRVAHFFLAEAYMAGAPVARLLGVPVLAMSRRSLSVYQANFPAAASIERRLHRQMSAIVANSRASLVELEGREGCDPARLGLIYNGVVAAATRPARARAEVRRALGLPDAAFVAITVANLNAYKGHADLLAALGLVQSRLPAPWCLLAVGGDFGIQAALEAQARALGIGANVRFLGARADVADLLGAADLGLLCSHQEGFSNAVIEKMAAGLAVIVTDVGGNPEAVRQGIDGLVIPPRDPRKLADAIVTLALDGAFRTRLGASGRQRVAERFTLDDCVSRYDALYRGLIDGRQPRDIAEIAPGARR